MNSTQGQKKIGSNISAPVTDASGYEKRHGVVPPRRKPVPSSSTTEQQPRRQEIQNQHRMSQSIRSSSPTSSSSVGGRRSSNSNKPLPPIPEPLSRASLLSTLDTFHRSLSHTRYAVSGLAALSVWGYTAREPTRVTVMCCSSDREIIRTWAKVAGWHLYPSQPELIGLPTCQKGVIRRVKLRGLESDETFDRQERVIPAELVSSGENGVIATQASVLTPVALLNQFAHTYLVETQRASDHGERTRRTAEEHAQRAREIASMIIWILERMNSTLETLSQTGTLSRSAEIFLPPTGQEIITRLPYAINAKFRAEFDMNFPSAVHLWTRCGLDMEVNQPDLFAEVENLVMTPAPLGRRSGSGSGSTSSSSRSISRSNTGKSSATTTTSNSEIDSASLAEWQIPDDLKMMMDQAAAEYHGKDMWR